MLLSVLSLVVTSPFFLHPLFERPSLSQIHYLTVTGLASILLLAVFAFFFPTPRVGRIPLPLIAAWGFFVALILSAVLCSTPLYSLKELLFPLTCGALFSAIVMSAPRRKDVDKILSAFCIVGFITAIYGIAQNYGFEILGYSARLKKGKLNVISVFGHPNYLAAYITPLVVIAANYFLEVRGAVRRIAALIAGVAFLFCILLAGTRGAWLSLVVSLPVLLLFRIRARVERIHWIGIIPVFGASVLGLFFLIFLILPLLGPRYNLRHRLEDKMPLISRFYGWQIAGEMLKAHPFFGVGYGEYKVLYWECVDSFQRREKNRIYDYVLNYGRGLPPRNVHNEFLEIATESGIAGFTAFIFFLTALFAKGWRALKTRLSTKQPPDNLPGILAAILCILIDAQFNFPLHQPLSAFLFWVLCALAINRTQTNLTG